MRRLLNTLYVTTQGAYLAREGETVVVRLERETRLRVPVHTLDGVVCLGHVGFSPQVMELCAERGVGVSFLSEHGRFWAKLVGPTSGNVLLRREQYRRADDMSAAGRIARLFVIGKMANARTVLLRAVRDRPEYAGNADLQSASNLLERIGRSLREDASLETTRGAEGEAARAYFGVFGHLITAQKDEFPFTGRSRRPPMDNVNALLSFLYTLLAHDVVGAIETVGLDPAVGFLHRDRPGRPGLALDLMEELRPYLADRLALSLINRLQVRGSGFERMETGGVVMTDETRKTVITAWQQRKQEELVHPFIGERMPIGLIPFVQSRLLARVLRDDLDTYPPFVWR